MKNGVEYSQWNQGSKKKLEEKDGDSKEMNVIKSFAFMSRGGVYSAEEWGGEITSGRRTGLIIVRSMSRKSWHCLLSS